MRGRVLQLRELGYSLDDICRLTKYETKRCSRILNETEETLGEKPLRRTPERTSPQTLWFFVSTGCNMRCSYCYASGGGFNFFPAAIMKKEVARVAVQKISQLIGDSIKTVNFFGGEPLLAYDTIKVVVEEFKKTGFTPHFTIVTNGTILTHDIIDFFRENNFFVTVSIDGPESIHDYNRKFGATKQGTFDTILKNFTILRENIRDIAIESTYALSTFHGGYALTDIAEFLANFTPLILIKKAESFPLLSQSVNNDPFISNPHFIQ